MADIEGTHWNIATYSSELHKFSRNLGAISQL